MLFDSFKYFRNIIHYKIILWHTSCSYPCYKLLIHLQGWACSKRFQCHGHARTLDSTKLLYMWCSEKDYLSPSPGALLLQFLLGGYCWDSGTTVDLSRHYDSSLIVDNSGCSGRMCVKVYFFIGRESQQGPWPNKLVINCLPSLREWATPKNNRWWPIEFPLV